MARLRIRRSVGDVVVDTIDASWKQGFEVGDYVHISGEQSVHKILRMHKGGGSGDEHDARAMVIDILHDSAPVDCPVSLLLKSTPDILHAYIARMEAAIDTLHHVVMDMEAGDPSPLHPRVSATADEFDEDAVEGEAYRLAHGRAR